VTGAESGAECHLCLESFGNPLIPPGDPSVVQGLGRDVTEAADDFDAPTCTGRAIIILDLEGHWGVWRVGQLGTGRRSCWKSGPLRAEGQP
jgi:hypothetical protein